MYPIDFPERNIVLRAGANPSTKDMHCCLAQHPLIPGQMFYCSVWKPEANELEDFYNQLETILLEYFPSLEDEKKKKIDSFLMAVIKSMPDINIAAMHTPPPIYIGYDIFKGDNAYVPDDATALQVDPHGKD